MANAALIFPPQWPAFGPPLGIASLKAWVEQVSDHKISLHDANQRFYSFLLEEETLSYLDITQEQRNLLEGIYRTVIPKFKHIMHGPSDNLQISDYYTLYSGLSSFLRLLSTHLSFHVELGDFKMPGNEFDSNWLEKAIEAPPPICDAIVNKFVDANDPSFTSADIIGLSCISQSQVFWTLMFCRRLRAQYGKPVIVGGSVFSRMAYRGCFPKHWFGELIDALCMHEGECPLVDVLDNVECRRMPFENVRGVFTGVALEGALPKTVRADELPPPNFDGLPLKGYLSPEVIIPVLCSRGCYWGKCEFCHHGMIYGGRYSSSNAVQFGDKLKFLKNKYDAHNFCIADEAIPPKIFRSLARELPDRSESGFVLSGMLKFEAYFQKEDWELAKRVGFDLIFIGLESASARVLESINKMTPMSDIRRNISDAAGSSVWLHLFAFYGFPGETALDADLTHAFLLNASDEIGSIGIGKFSLEHGAPIFKHPEALDVVIRTPRRGDLDVYYDYECDCGITQAEALDRAINTRRAAERIPNFATAFWCPREILPSLIAKFGRDRLARFTDDMIRSDWRGVGPVILLRGLEGEGYFVRLANLIIYKFSREFVDLLDTELFSRADLSSILAMLENRASPSSIGEVVLNPVGAQKTARREISIEYPAPL